MCRGGSPAAPRSAGRAGDDHSDPEEKIRAIAALAEPTRHRLFSYILRRAEPVGREEAAAALDITRPLAAFHLDRLVELGLLSVEFRRLTGRSGPGAGRPAKLYRVSRTGINVSIPPRRHGLLASWLAEALAASPGENAIRTLRAFADAYGQDLGLAAHGLLDRRRSRQARIQAGVHVLDEEGFAPRLDGDAVLLANCPFQPVAANHRPLICAEMNRTLMGAFATVLNAGLSASYEPTTSMGCCIALRPPR